MGLLFLIVTCQAHSQSIIDSLSRVKLGLRDTVGEALAELALKNLQVKVLDKEIEVNKYNWQLNKASWLNNLRASFNMNEANLKSTPVVSGERNIFYPRYNFNLTVPLGDFITNPKQSKIARTQYEQSQVRKEIEINSLKEAIKVAYQNYNMHKTLLALQETALQDETLIFSQVEAKFKVNGVPLETFTQASKRLSDVLAKKITLMRDVNVSKYQLETLIGMRLEDALAAIKRL